METMQPQRAGVASAKAVRWAFRRFLKIRDLRRSSLPYLYDGDRGPSMDNENSYLFHGTGIYALAAIIAEDRLLEGHHWGHIDEPAGPRFSKRLDVAADFTLYKGNHIEGGVLVLDRSRLQVDYLLEGCALPRDGSQAWGEESEIAAVAKVIEPLSE